MNQPINNLYHDLRGKLASMLLYAEILEKKGSELSEDQKGILSKIKQSIKEAGALLEEAETDKPNPD